MKRIFGTIFELLLRGFTPQRGLFTLFFWRPRRQAQLRVADGDVWYRAITNTRHYRRGRIHHAALRGRAISAPQNASTGWESEISGRLRSIANDIREDGERRARLQKERSRAKGESGKDFEFVAVMFAIAGDVRRWEVDRCDVIFDPNPEEDPAHANLVFITNPPERVLSVLDDVIDSLGHCPAGELHRIPTATGGPPAGR